MAWLGSILFTAALVLGPVPTNADVTKTAKSRYGIHYNHSDLIDRRIARQYSTSNQSLPDDIRVYRSPRFDGGYTGIYRSMAEAVAQKHGVPVDLFLRLVQQESNWNARAKSKAGAVGLTQLMPDTARKLGVNPHVPQQNLEGGAHYLKQQYNRFRSWRLALAAYNAGPSTVAKYNGVPPYKETENFVKKILGK